MKYGNLVFEVEGDGSEETIIRMNGSEAVLKARIEGRKVKLIWAAPPCFVIRRRELQDRIDAKLARPAVEAALKKD